MLFMVRGCVEVVKKCKDFRLAVRNFPSEAGEVLCGLVLTVEGRLSISFLSIIPFCMIAGKMLTLNRNTLVMTCERWG